jgi:glucose/arabinose dehydrogenase
VNATITPDLLFEAHSSTLDLMFYEGEQFPPEYKGSAFVTLKGSWNSSEPTGYKVVRVPFKDGRPEGYYEKLRHLVLDIRQAACGSLGTARCPRGGKGWFTPNRRYDLACFLHR